LFPTAAQEVNQKYKKNGKKHLNMIYHPYAGAALRGRFSQFFGVWGHAADLITQGDIQNGHKAIPKWPHSIIK